jgi:DNA-binding GntR family transcriptional regulator
LPKQPSADVVNLASRALQRRSLHEDVVEVLREMILEGQLKPGERVIEPELCRKLNVSRTPMREALKVLAVERLVELQPSRGAVVTSIRIEEVVEHFEMLEVLDAAIGELAAARMTAAELGEIEALHRKIVEHHNAGRRAKYFDANQAIHAKLAAATHNTSLMATHLRFSRKITRVRYAANFSQTRWDESLAEHEEIMAALRRRDGTRLSALMREHMRATGRSVVAVLERETGRREA